MVEPLELECVAFAWTSRPRRGRGGIVAVHMLIFACAAGNPAGRLLVWFWWVSFVSGSASAELGLEPSGAVPWTPDVSVTRQEKFDSVVPALPIQHHHHHHHLVVAWGSGGFPVFYSFTGCVAHK